MRLLFSFLSTRISNNLTDEEVIDKYLSTRKAEYFDLLYKRYSSKIFGKSLSLLKDVDYAHDATQEIFVKILLNLSKFSGKSKFSTWIYSITYNYCIDVIRRRKKEKSDLVDDFTQVYDKADDEIAEAFLLEMNVNRLDVVLNEIAVGDKAILLMKYQDEMSIKEISEVLDKSESAVKMKIKRAKEKCKKVYDEFFSESS